MKRRVIINVSVVAVALAALLLLAGFVGAWPMARPLFQGGAPTVVSYQGQVKVNGSPYSGTGYFKFAVVDSAGSTSYWSNDGTSAAGSEPVMAVELAVSGGLFNVLLGDTSLTNMTQALSAGVFSGPERYLRVWFSPEGSAFTLLSPDRGISAVPYALQAEQAADADTVDGMHGADLEESVEIDDDIATHESFADAHHARYTDSEAFGAVLDNDGAGSSLDADTVDGMHGAALEESAEIDADIATHAAIADAHHARYTDAEAFGAVLANDGAGSGLDADTVDGMHGADLEESAEIDSLLTTHTATSSAHHARYTDAEAFGAVLDNDGAGSGLDADMVDGMHGAALEESAEIDADIATHAADDDAHHARYTDAEAFGAVLDNDGAGSGLDADTVDGMQGAVLEESAEIDADIATHAGLTDAHHARYTDAEAFGAVLANDGAGSGLDADRLDGQHGAFYQSASNINAGTLSASRFSAYGDLGTEGYLGNAVGDLAQNNGVLQPSLNADTVDGQHGSAFAAAAHDHDSSYWKLSGNAGTDPNAHFLGTTDNVGLTLGVNSAAAVRIDTARNVGLGTDSPTQRLTVRGNGLVLGEDDPVARGYAPAIAGSRRSVCVSGKHAYVVSTESNRLEIFDVSNPDNVIARGYAEANLELPYSVYVSGKYAYVACEASGLAIFDVSDPQVIVPRGYTDANLDGARSAYVSGKYAYVVSYYNHLLAIFDVSDPDSIVPKGYTSDNLAGPLSVYVSGKYAYVASHENNTLAIFDVSDPDSIVAKGYTDANLEGPYSVYVSSKHAYVASYYNHLLAIFDVSDPDAIIPRGYTDANLEGPYSIRVSGKYAYVASYDNNRLAIFDVSDADNIVARGYTSANLGLPTSVYVSGKYAYVTSQDDYQLAVFALNHLESPTLETGNLQSGYLDVTDNAMVGNNLYVQGGLNVGPGGALIEGDVAVAGELQVAEDGAGSGLDADMVDGQHASDMAVPSGAMVLGLPNDSRLTGAGYTDLGVSNVTYDEWRGITTSDAPSRRYAHTSVWTGSEMIVWGGVYGSFLNDGARYNPATDAWTAITATDAPAARYYHTAVWTGSEMIVWGGRYDDGGINYLNTGGRYNPATDTWTATTTTNAPSGRYQHSAVWTGSEMIVWGGYGGSNLNSGGRYNPSTDSWTATTTTGAPTARDKHTAVWTGSEMIVWGGYGGGYLNSGGRYAPGTDSWTATTTTDAPSVRYDHSAIWTGGEMIVWGGWDGNAYMSSGGRYNPSTNTWNAVTTNALTGRGGHTAVWTGGEMWVWGGYDGSYLSSGGRHDPTANTWTPITTANAPSGRDIHTAVWTGSRMLVWGGTNRDTLSDGGGYRPSPSLLHLYQKP
jgi:hypothetical protein